MDWVKEILITLRSDLKILISILLTLFLSCQSVEISSYSDEFEMTSAKLNRESELIVLEWSSSLYIRYSDIYKHLDDITYNEESSLPLPHFKPLDRPMVISGFQFYEVDEYLLEIPLFVKLEKPIVPKVTAKEIVVLKPKPVEVVATVEPQKTAETIIVKQIKPEKSESAVEVVNTTPKREEVFVELGDMEVLIGIGFTVEMDQSGWLYEKSVEHISFNNKFYTNSSVLFEFVADKSGDYTLEFSKYSSGSVEYSRMEISAVEIPKTASTNREGEEVLIITPEEVTEYLSEKDRLEEQMLNIGKTEDPDVVYFRLAEIYYEEGLLRKAKEYYEYIYDNYPFSIHYAEAEKRMSYIINNFLKVR